FRPPEQLQHLYHTSPYADRLLVEFLLRIPADVLCGPGEPRKLMRRAFLEFLPPEVAKRRSKGSYTAAFLKTVRPAARSLLDDQRTLMVVELGYVDPVEFRERLRRVTMALSCNAVQLQQIILLELWLRSHAGEAVQVAHSAPSKYI